jgi:hypothetical protein
VTLLGELLYPALDALYWREHEKNRFALLVRILGRERIFISAGAKDAHV